MQNELNDARTTIERLKAKSESEPVVGEAPQAQVEEPDLVVTVEVGDGVSFDIEISNDDNVENVAKHFVAEHELEDDAIPALVAYIEDQLSLAHIEESAEDSSEDNVEEDQVQNQSFNRRTANGQIEKRRRNPPTQMLLSYLLHQILHQYNRPEKRSATSRKLRGKYHLHHHHRVLNPLNLHRVFDGPIVQGKLTSQYQKLGIHRLPQRLRV